MSFLSFDKFVYSWRAISSEYITSHGVQACWWRRSMKLLQWRHRPNERNGVSNHRRLHCLLNCWFRRRSKKTSKLRVLGLFAGNSQATGEFPAQMTSNAENVSLWWRHHENACTGILTLQRLLAYTWIEGALIWSFRPDALECYFEMAYQVIT